MTAGDPSELEMTILRYLNDNKSLPEISKLAKIEPRVVGAKLARLQADGFVTEEGFLTRKGVEAVHSSR